MTKRTYGDRLYDISELLKYVLNKAGFDVTVNVSLVSVTEPDLNTNWECTSKQIPTLQNQNDIQRAYELGDSTELHTRICNKTREFLIGYCKKGMGYSFIMVHIGLSEYQKYIKFDCTTADTDWVEVTVDCFTTLIDLIIESFLRSYCNPKSIPAIDAIKLAGDRYVRYLLCGDNPYENINIHNDLNVLSSLQYEKQANSGKLIIAPQSITQNLDIVFTAPISIHQYSKARKLFEIATGNVFLVGDSRYIYGIATAKTLANTNIEEYLQVQIHGPLNWEILSYHPKLNTTESIVQYRNSYYQVKASNCNLNDFRLAIAKSTHDANIDVLWEIVRIASNQSHGTTIVFSPEAAYEANRLEKSCFRIKPTKIQHITNQITSIDGAVLCDMYGTCYALGIILDGISSQSEDISRGARHNSAKRYKNAHPTCVICVISEDGGITIE